MKAVSRMGEHDERNSNNRFFSKVVRVMLIFLSILLLAFIVLIGVMIVYSPGDIKPFTNGDEASLENSIAEKVFVNIGGVEQGLFIWGKDLTNPVLLFVHGGPCFSEYFLFEKYPTGLEEIYTICHWEQRGGGLSSNLDLLPESITMDQLKEDTIAVTNYLRKRFGQEKIYLAAHSGGTFFAIQAAAEKPELYHAYIGIAQITNQAASEKIAYQYLLENYQALENKKMVEKLKQYPLQEDENYVSSFFKSMVRDQAMHDLGVGTMRNMKSLESGIVLPIMLCKGYTLKEKFNLWKSKISFIRKTPLADELITTDLTKLVTELKIPVYFFSGAYDLTVNHDLSKAYLNELSAPRKAFYSFENSAHSPIFEEPEKTVNIFTTDILGGAQ
jgi:pimeloyl-ACP methyl ester carboxylesterase